MAATGVQPQRRQPCCVLRDASETASEAALPPQGIPAPQGPRLAFSSAQDVGPSPWAQALRDPPGSHIPPFCVRAACSESTWTSIQTLPLPAPPRNLGAVSGFLNPGSKGPEPQGGTLWSRTPSVQDLEHSGGRHHLSLRPPRCPPPSPGWALPAGTLKVGQCPAHFSSPPPKVDAPQGAGLNGNFSRCCSGYKGLRVPLPQQPLPPSVPCKPPPPGGGGREPRGKGSLYQTQEGGSTKSLKKTPETHTASQ